MLPRPGDRLDSVAAISALRLAGYTAAPDEFCGLPTYQDNDEGLAHWLWSDLLLWAQQRKRREAIETRVISDGMNADAVTSC